jgi:hypothetical protein
MLAYRRVGKVYKSRSNYNIGGKGKRKKIVGIGWVEEVVTSQTTLSIAD